MAKKVEASEMKSEPSQAAVPAEAIRQQVRVDDKNAVTTYANFCHVTGTPEEWIIDVALISQPVGPQTKSIVIDQRLVLNYFTAKRLLGALQMSIQRHEQAFSALETDVQNRIQTGRPG
ncbi:MAG: DUF3467 domain-containing protein [Planctomycetales bacterium]